MNSLFHILIRITAVYVLLISYSCQSKVEPLKIGISRERQDVAVRYSTWLQHQNIPFSYINLSKLSLHAAADSLQICDALLLTGGEDIYPGLYGKESDTARCGEFNPKRDSLEFMLYSKAKQLKMPIMGICRGLQLINVAEGGNLYIDLPEDKASGELHRQGDEGWTNHTVRIKKGSLLANCVQKDSMSVASNHHQGIERLGEKLAPMAYTRDGLIESIGWADTTNTNFLIAVQWHPEWMDKADVPSGKIAELFLMKANNYHVSGIRK